MGNLLPHPVTLFAIFALGVVLLSGVAGWMDWSVIDPRPEGARGRSPTGMIEAVSLLNADGLRRIVENLVENFVRFVPLGTVLVAMLGVGVAEASGSSAPRFARSCSGRRRGCSRWPSSSPAWSPTPPPRPAT